MCLDLYTRFQAPAILQAFLTHQARELHIYKEWLL